MASADPEKIINWTWAKAGFAGICILILAAWIYTAEAENRSIHKEMCDARKEHKTELRACRDDTKAIATEAIAAINELKSTLVEIKIYLRESRYERVPSTVTTR